MIRLITIALLTLSFSTFALESRDTDKNTSKPSYGSPTLYYSPEGARERRELELLKESNNIAREQLNLERKRISDEERNEEHKRTTDDN